MERMVRAMKRGFTLAEVVVALSIAAVLGLVFYSFDTQSSSQTSDQTSRVALAALTLNDIARAIASLESTNVATSFLQTVGAYPGTLSQLTHVITTSNRNSCNRSGTDNYLGSAIPSGGVAVPGYVAGWNGPYYAADFPVNGSFTVASGFVTQDSLIRTPSAPPTNPKNPDLAGVLAIRMPAVDTSDAHALDLQVDGILDGTDGTVRYPAVGNPVAVDYVLAVSNC